MKIKAFLLCLIPLLLMGCWDAEEVTNMALVLAAGFDRLENKWTKVSVQLPIAEELLPISGSPQVNKRSFGVLTAEAESAFGTMPGLQNKTQWTLFFGQLKTVLFGWDLAVNGIKGPIDALRRHPDIPPQARILLVRDQASTMLDHTLWHKGIPGISLVSFFQVKGKQDQAFGRDIWEVARDIDAKTQDAFIPILEYDQSEETFIISGLGVFHHERLVGELTGEEARMFGFLSGKARNAYLYLTFPEYGGINMREVRGKAKIGLKKNGTKPLITINIKAWGKLGESTKMVVNLKRKDRDRINKAFSAYLEREMRKTIEKLQALNSDILALGEVYRIHYPLTWKATDWEKLYPRIPIQLSVDFKMQDYGIMR